MPEANLNEGPATVTKGCTQTREEKWRCERKIIRDDCASLQSNEVLATDLHARISSALPRTAFYGA